MTVRVLAFAEAGMYTGFEKVMRETLTPLANQNDGDDFDITVMGLGYRGQPLIRYPFEVIPSSADPRDPLGASFIDEYVKRYKADVVWILHDLWQVSNFVAFAKSDVPIVSYSPVDCPNMKWYFTLCLGRITRPSVYTNFGAHEIAAGVQEAIDIMAEAADINPRAFVIPKLAAEIQHPYGTKMQFNFEQLMRAQNKEFYRVIPHGLDHAKYQPRDKAASREVFGIPKDAFVIGAVNANQFRKLQDRVIRAFARMAEQVPNAFLAMHCAGQGIQGYDLGQLCRYYGVENRVWRIHEHKYELTEDELLSLYNTFDVQINLSSGEGWGLTSMEGAACGIPQIVTDWGPAEEIWGDHAVRVPVIDYRMEPKYLNTCHGIPNVQAASDILIDLYENRDKLAVLSDLAKAKAAQQWPWQRVADATGKLLLEAVNAAKPKPVTIQQMLEARTETVRSALRGVTLLPGTYAQAGVAE